MIDTREDGVCGGIIWNKQDLNRTEEWRQNLNEK